MADFCLACGGTLVKGSRASASDISVLLKRLLTKRLEENHMEADLDSIISCSCACRACFKSYTTHQEKEERLFAATANSVNGIESVSSSPNPVTPMRRVASSIDSDLMSATKRRCANSETNSDDSPPIVVGIGYKSGSKSYNQTSPRRKNFISKLARSGDSAKSVAREALNDLEIRKYLAVGIGKLIKTEIKTLCSERVDSVQRSSSKDDILSFPWARILDEVKQHCPLLLSFMLASTDTKAQRPNRVHLICTIVCMLSKYHYCRMSLLQKLVSAIMYAGHCGTMVYRRLQQLSICMSKNAIYTLITSLGQDYDSNVKTWQASLLSRTRTQDQMNSSDMPSMLEFCDNSSDDEDLHVANDLHVHYVDTFLNIEPSEENDHNGTTIEDRIDETESDVSRASTPNPPTFSDISNNLDTCNFDEDVSESHKDPWNGFKIVGDNIDITINPRHMRVDEKAKLLHFFHCYAVRDRIDFSGASEDPNPFLHKELCELPVTDLLPTASDDISLLSNLSVLIGRILVKELPYFTRSFDCATTDHITHTYYDEMAVKSMTEPLGIILKNENVLEDMIEILLHLNEYVPCHTQTALDCVTQLEVTADAIHEILLGGDQLTRKRVESAKEGRKNDVSLLTRLKGFIPVTEDWHAKKIFLEMIWKWLYNTKSFLDKGTLCHLRNVIDRRNISATAADDFNACDDFFTSVVQCHVVAAAMNHLEMNDRSDMPVHPLLHDGLWSEDSEK